MNLSGNRSRFAISSILQNAGAFSLAFFIAIAFQNCAPKGSEVEETPSKVSDGKVVPSDIDPKVLWYQPEFELSYGDVAKATLLSDLLRYQNLQGLLNIPETNYAIGIFGKTDRTRITYLSDRIKRVVGPDSTTPTDLYAANLGAANFFERLARLQVGDNATATQLAKYTDPRIGEIVTVQYGTLGVIGRIGTLVHEARHSDCTGGVKTSSLNAYIKSYVKTTQVSTEITGTCGHFHNICPPDSDYAGQLACDTHLWGSFAVGGMFSLLIDSKCTNCSEDEKNQGMIDAQDQLSRVTQIDRLTDKTNPAPWPDMTHSLEHIEDETPIQSVN